MQILKRDAVRVIPGVYRPAGSCFHDLVHALGVFYIQSVTLRIGINKIKGLGGNNGALVYKLIRSGIFRLKNGARQGIDVSALLRRVMRGDKTAAANARLYNEHTERQTADDSVSDGESEF